MRIPPPEPERYPRTSIDETLAKFINHLLTKKTLKPSTIERKVKVLKSLMKYGVELSNPDSFVLFLNICDWASGTKDLAIHCYNDYLNMLLALPKNINYGFSPTGNKDRLQEMVTKSRTTLSWHEH